MEFSGGVDLFGQPLIERGGRRGRPPHVRTEENSNKVNLLFACGYELKDVAAALGITQPTLRKHYFSECEGRRIAAVRMRALQLARLNTQAADGNVAAEKALIAIIEREQMKQQSARFGDKPRPALTAKGIKQQRREAAWDAGKDDPDWGDLLHGEGERALPN